jgi:signal peptidase II
MSIPTGRPRWGLFLGLAATVVVLDQLSKAWLRSILDPDERLEIIGDLVRFIHAQNSGALFGLFRDQAYLFALVSIGVVALIVWYHRSSGRNTWLSVALGLLLGGALGNMIDRFRFGYVTDWVDVGLGDLRFYTFNVADAAISCAILLLILLALWPSKPTPTETTTDAPSPTTPEPAEADA